MTREETTMIREEILLQWRAWRDDAAKLLELCDRDRSVSIRVTATLLTTRRPTAFGALRSLIGWSLCTRYNLKLRPDTT